MKEPKNPIISLMKLMLFKKTAIKTKEIVDI